jgi:hypothetical protein
MAHEVKLPERFRIRGWKAKIRDRERVEPPHVTVMRGPDEWRIGLRNCRVLEPPGGAWNDIPRGVIDALGLACPDLRAKWDEMYPENPIGVPDE